PRISRLPRLSRVRSSEWGGWGVRPSWHTYHRSPPKRSSARDSGAHTRTPFPAFYSARDASSVYTVFREPNKAAWWRRAKVLPGERHQESDGDRQADCRRDHHPGNNRLFS